MIGISSSTNPNPNPNPNRLFLLNLLCIIGFGLVAMTICLPSMPSWSKVFSTNQANVQLSFSSFVIAFGLTQVIYGPLSDRYGRRRLLAFGFALASVGSIMAAMAPSLPSLTFARFLQGAGAGAGMVLGRALVQDHFSGSDRARVMAYVGMAMGLCAPLATVIGGQVHVYFGWRANFWVIGALAATLMVTTWIGLPVDARARCNENYWFRDMLNAYRQLIRVPAFVAFTGVVALSTGPFYVFLAGTPSVLANYGVGPSEVGFFIMVVPFSYIAGNFLTSRLIKRFDETELMFIGQCFGLFSVCLVLAMALVGIHSPFAVAGPLILLGLGQGLLMPTALAGTVNVVPALAGAAAGIAGLLQQLSGAFGGYAIGFFDNDTAVEMALFMIVFILVAFACQLWLRRIQTYPERNDT